MKYFNIEKNLIIYNLRYASKFVIQPIQSVYHGKEPAPYLRPKIWKLIAPVI